MDIKLKIWRQKSPSDKGSFETFSMKDIDEDMSFMEMLDVLNEQLLHYGKDPVSFSHDCREGICGACGVMINGRAHGPRQKVTTCQQ